MTGKVEAADCQHVRLSLGVLVLGVIDPEERALVEGHLAECDRCSAELGELAELPGLMHRVDLDQALAGLPTPSSQFSARVIEAAKARKAAHRRRRRFVIAAGTAVAAAAAVLAFVVLPGDDGGSGSTGTGNETVVAATDPKTSVHASIDLASEQNGTRLQIELKGVAPGEHCRLVAYDKAGGRDVAASWVANYDGWAHVTTATRFPKASISWFEVVRPDGSNLVSVPVS